MVEDKPKMKITITTIDDQLQCECGKAVKTLVGMKLHKRCCKGPRKEPTAEELTCDMCRRTYKSVGGLSYHKLSCGRSGEFQCMHCNRVYKSQRGLTTHQRYCQMEDDDKVKCDFCPNKFCTVSGARAHMKRCADNPDRAVSEKAPCRWCKKVFTVRGMKNHERTCRSKGALAMAMSISKKYATMSANKSASKHFARSVRKVVEPTEEALATEEAVEEAPTEEAPAVEEATAVEEAPATAVEEAPAPAVEEAPVVVEPKKNRKKKLATKRKTEEPAEEAPAAVEEAAPAAVVEEAPPVEEAPAPVVVDRKKTKKRKAEEPAAKKAKKTKREKAIDDALRALALASELTAENFFKDHPEMDDVFDTSDFV